MFDAVAQARRPGGAGDAARGGDLESAVGCEDEPPSRGEGLEPVVPAAQAAEVVAVGLAALAVGDDVIQVDPRHRLPAAGLAAGAIPGRAEATLRRGGPVPVDRRRPVEHRAPAAAVRGIGLGMVRAAAAGDALQLRAALSDGLCECSWSESGAAASVGSTL